MSGERLQALLERSEPRLKDLIRLRGLYLKSEFMRAMIAPYKPYDSQGEFDVLEACGAEAVDNHALTRCLQSFAYDAG